MENTVKFTVIIPKDDYCETGMVICPCLGLDGKEEERCGFFKAYLSLSRVKGSLKTEKCKACKQMTQMLINESI